MSFFTGSGPKYKKLSTLTDAQQPGLQNLINAGQGAGAGGAFGTAADYYRGLLSNDNADINAFAAPELRRFREQTIPDIAEQFAGMGSGGLSSSGFQNASINAGTDLSERLGAIRAQLRQQGAQGLQSIGQAGLGNYSENIQEQRTPGFLESMAPAIGSALTSFATGGLSSLGGVGMGGIGNWFNKKKGASSPYGSNQQNIAGPAF